MQYRIGVDIGTTSTKAVLFDESNQAVREATFGYPTERPSPIQAEQDPFLILTACEAAIRNVAEGVDGDILFVSFSSAMHSLLAIDKEGKPLTRLIIWSDNRSLPQVARLKAQANASTYYQKTGTPLHPMSPLAKLHWMKDETNLFERAYKFIGIKEFVLHQWTGQYVIDYSIASATGLFNLHELRFDEEILGELGLGETSFSTPMDGNTSLTPNRPEKLGLSSQTVFMIGASDGCLANLGSGATNPGEVALTIGTSGAVRMTVDRPLLDPQGRTFCYYLSEDRWVIGGAVNNGGNVLQWLNELLYEAEGSVFEQLPLALRDVSIGADGLFFYPYINGERAPFWDGTLRGSYVGLSAFHKKHHLIRATLEGVLFNIKEVLSILEEIGGRASTIRASGGFLQSKEWTDLTAAILGMPLMLTSTKESSSLGSVLLPLNEPYQVEILETIIPNPNTVTQYRALFDQYRLMR